MWPFADEKQSKANKQGCVIGVGYCAAVPISSLCKRKICNASDFCCRLRLTQPIQYTTSAFSKTHISPYAQLIPGGVVHGHGPLKGTKHICNQCFYTGNFWRWSAHVSPRYRRWYVTKKVTGHWISLTNDRIAKKNCTSYVLAHRV